MSLNDDLATLRVLTTGHWTTRAALERVEAEIERLRRENNNLGNALAQERSRPEGTFDQWARLQAAEAEIARLQRERASHLRSMDELDAERRELADDLAAERDAHEAGRHLREAAEAENERLRDGLRRIAEIPTGAVDDGLHPRDIARALLAEDGAT